jgi:hypothetical protein
MSERLLLVAPGLTESALRALRVAVRDWDVRVVAAGAVSGQFRQLSLERPLPWRLRRYRSQLSLVERIPVADQLFEDELAVEDAAALLLLRRHRGGDASAASELFAVWFNRALAYARIWLGDPAAAQRTALIALRDVLASASVDGQRAGFRALLVVRLHAAAGAPAYEPPPMRRRPLRDDEQILSNLAKLSAEDVCLVLGQVSADNRRLLALLHVLKLEPGIAGGLLGFKDVRGAERAALRELRLAVERYGRSGASDRLASHSFGIYSPVVRSRWAALPARI